MYFVKYFCKRGTSEKHEKASPANLFQSYLPILTWVTHQQWATDPSFHSQCFQDWQLDTKLMNTYSSVTFSSNTSSWLQLPLVHTLQLVSACSTTHHHFEFVKQTWKIQPKLFQLQTKLTTCTIPFTVP